MLIWRFRLTNLRLMNPRRSIDLSTARSLIHFQQITSRSLKVVFNPLNLERFKYFIRYRSCINTLVMDDSLVWNLILSSIIKTCPSFAILFYLILFSKTIGIEHRADDNHVDTSFTFDFVFLQNSFPQHGILVNISWKFVYVHGIDK